MLFHTTAAYFTEAIQREGFLLLDFYAPWCAPCRALAPVLDALSDELDLAAYSICTDTDAALAEKFSVVRLPTVLLLKDAKIIKRWEVPDTDALCREIRSLTAF